MVIESFDVEVDEALEESKKAREEVKRVFNIK